MNKPLDFVVLISFQLLFIGNVIAQPPVDTVVNQLLLPASSTLNFFSPKVYPKTTNYLFMGPVVQVVQGQEEKRKSQTAANRKQIELLSEQIVEQEAVRQLQWEYYEQEHLRLAGIFGVEATDNGIHVTTYTSTIQRTGDVGRGMSWLISGLNTGKHKLALVHQMKRILQVTFTALDRYARVREQEVLWPGTEIIIIAPLSQRDSVKLLISELNEQQIPWGFVEAPLSNDTNFRVEVNSPAIFMKDYEQLLNSIGELDHDIRRKQQQIALLSK